MNENKKPNKIGKVIFFIAGFAIAVLLASTIGCSPKLSHSDQKNVSSQYMNALLSGQTEKAIQVTSGSEEDIEAVLLLTNALRLKRENEGIKTMEFIYISESPTDDNRTNVVFSQKVDGKSSQENIVVEMVYDPSKSKWLVENLILR